MKFRYKVLFVNIILLSAALGTVGYLMIRRNFELAKNTQIQNAVVENNILQASVEYELLQIINGGGNYDVKQELKRIGTIISNGMSALPAGFYIKYDSEYVYSFDDKENMPTDMIFENISVGGKKYLISRQEDGYYIYVTSYSTINGRELCVVSRRDISEAYSLMDSQISFYRMLVLLIVSAGGAVMYGLSLYFTRPLEMLNRVTDGIIGGNYYVRMKVTSGDEVKRRERFVAYFTHEIKTPMTAIIGYADTMRSMDISEEERFMALNYIFSEGRRLERMSLKLFDLIYYKQKEIEMRPIRTSDICGEIAGIIKPVLDLKKITLVTDAEPAVIYGSRELLITAFINIIDNAKKASDEGAFIYFSGVFKESGAYEFKVTDSGVGMTKEDAARICEEFYMADKSRSRKEGGAGLGMSFVAVILERHGAAFSVDSTLGEGTSVSVTFEPADCDTEVKD